MKNAINKIGAFALNYPLVAIFAVAVLIYGAGYVGKMASSWYFERGVEQADEKRTEQKKVVSDLEEKADTALGEANAYAEQKQAKVEEVKQTKKDLTNLKTYAKHAKKKADDSGHRDIPDSDVPSNAELCARANSLGVRCDSDK
jgi:Tfp pilus assembly protein PilO